MGLMTRPRNVKMPKTCFTKRVGAPIFEHRLGGILPNNSKRFMLSLPVSRPTIHVSRGVRPMNPRHAAALALVGWYLDGAPIWLLVKRAACVWAIR